MIGARICSPISLIVALLILAGSLDAAVAATAEECTSAWQQCELNCGLYPGGTVANNYCHADCATKQSVCIGTSKSETSAKPTNLPPKNNVGIRPITSGGVKNRRQSTQKAHTNWNDSTIRWCQARHDFSLGRRSQWHETSTCQRRNKTLTMPKGSLPLKMQHRSRENR